MAAGYPRHFGHEILRPVVDDMIETVGLGQFDLVGRTGGADHRGAEMFPPIARRSASMLPAAAWKRMVSPALTFEGAQQQILRRHALQHHGCRLLVGDAVGNKLVGGDHALPA